MSLVYGGVLLSIIILGQLAEANPKTLAHRPGKCRVMPDPGWAILLAVVLALISGFRYRVGTDFMVYYRWQVSDWGTAWRQLISMQEGGFALLAKLSRTVWDDPQSLIFFSAVLTVGLYCLTIYRHSPLFTVSMLLYLFLGDWQGGFNGIRQYLAAAVLFAGHRYIFTREWKKYFVVVFAAMLFHTSAVVMLFPYFLLNRKPDMTHLVFLAVGAAILRFSYEGVFRLINLYKGGAMDIGASAYAAHSVSVFRVLAAFMPVALYLVFGDKTNHSAEADFYIIALYVHAFSMLAGMGSAYLSRIGIYTGATASIGYAYMFQTITDEKTRKLTVFMALLVLFLYWLYSLQAGGIAAFHWAFENV